MMVIMTPAERLAAIARARAEYDELQGAADRAHGRLMTQIGKAAEEAAALPVERKRELGPSAVARVADFTREYIAQLRSAPKP